MEELFDKISNALTIDELDDFIKMIWMHDHSSIETVVTELTARLSLKVQAENNQK